MLLGTKNNECYWIFRIMNATKDFKNNECYQRLRIMHAIRDLQ